MAELSLLPEDRERLADKFPGRIPVFVLRDKRIDPSIPHLPKTKFLVPRDLRVGQFIFIIRRQLKLPAEKALFLFIGGALPTTSCLMSEMHSLHKSPDGALRVTYMSESVFGGDGGDHV